MHACKKPQIAEKDEESGCGNCQETIGASWQWWRVFSGLMLSVCAGLFSACQFATMSFGMDAVQRASGCEASLIGCPAFLQEEFNTFGSYNASFGIGCAIVTTFYYLSAVVFERSQGRPVPPLHFKVMSKWGSLSGILWVLGHFFQLSAVARSGGPAFVQPMNLAIQSIVSGAWGLIYYKEVESSLRAGLWSLAMTWTVIFVALLGGEKAA